MVTPGYKQTEVGVIPVDWDIKPIGEIFEFLTTANNSRGDLQEYGDVAYIHYGDIHTKLNHYLDISKIILPYIDRKKLRNPNFLKEGDIVIADASEDNEGLGKSVEILYLGEIQAVAGLHTFLLRDKIGIFHKGFKGYLQSIKCFKSSIDRIATGLKVYGISKSSLKQIQIPIPPIEEQRAIAIALSDVDALITSLDKLIAKKRAIKTATMQQLLTGKKRLPGFNRKWSQQTFGKIVEKIVGGGTPSRSKRDFWGGNIPWATVKDFASYDPFHTEEYITLEGLKNSSTNLIPAATLVISTRMALGKAIIYQVDVCINQDLKALFLKDGVDIGYVYYWLQHYAAIVESLGSGSTVKGISLTDLKSIAIFKPNFEEQKAISKVLYDMDAEIAALEVRRNKTKAIKQGMMQELLTGRTRLI